MASSSPQSSFEEAGECRKKCRSRRIATALGLCLAVAGIPALGVEHKFDGVYTGSKLLTKGSSPSCSVEQNVSVTIHSEILTFTDSNLRNFSLNFYPRQDGSFGDIYVDAGGASVNIRDRVIGDVIEANVTDPPCEYHWHLKKE
jgi:hypothetical protein